MNNLKKDRKDVLLFDIFKRELNSFYLFHEIISEPKSFKIHPLLRLWSKKFNRKNL